jgi:hypothetical protein
MSQRDKLRQEASNNQIALKRLTRLGAENLITCPGNVASLRGIWFCSDTLLGCLLKRQHLILRKHSLDAKVL